MQPKPFTPTTKLTLVLLTIGIVVLAAFAFGVFGETQIGITLKTETDLEDGLVGHWTFDGPDMLQNVTDKSGQGNNGFLTNFTSTTTTFGSIGQALEFDGSNDLIDIGTGLDFTSSFTITTWIYKKNASAVTSTTFEGDNLLHKGGASGDPPHNKQFVIYDNSGDGTSNEAIAWFSESGGTNNSVVSSGLITLNEWHHVSVVYNGSNITLYHNGSSVEGPTSISTPTSGSETVYLGGHESGLGGFHDGFLDDYRIYNRALSADEISRLYELGNTTHVGTTLGAVGSSPNLSTGLVGHWTFDGPDMDWSSTTAEVIDKSGNGNYGDVKNFGSEPAVFGKIGQALEFDGVDDVVEVEQIAGINFNTSDTFTLSAWIFYTANPDNFGRIIDNYEPGIGGYSMHLYDDESLAVFVEDSGYTGDVGRQGGTAALTVNQWHHVVGVYDGSDWVRYIDGSQKDLGTSYVSGTTNAQDTFRIGRRDIDREFQGKIDDVRVYNRALLASEVSRLYELGNTTHVGTTLGAASNNPDLSTGLVGHWTFDGPDLLNNATDKSGQGNTGYLTGFTSTTTTFGPIGQALDFSGSDSVDIPDNGTVLDLEIGGAITVSTWIKFTTADTNRGIVTKASGFDGWTLSEDNTTAGLIEGCDGSGGCATSAAAYNDGEWHHVVFVADDGVANEQALWINGVKEADTETVTPDGDNTHVLQIGRSQASGRDFWDGEIDDVRLYNRALSADEIERLYKLGR